VALECILSQAIIETISRPHLSLLLRLFLTDAMSTTPDFQKNLIIVLSMHGINGTGPSKTSSWLLHRDDAWHWLESRRPFFPSASSQELVALGLLPEDKRLELARIMSGADPCDEKASADINFCQTPVFTTFTPTCALCAIPTLASGGPKAFASFFHKADRHLHPHVQAAFPAALRLDGFDLNSHATPSDAEAGALSWRDAHLLNHMGLPQPEPSIHSKPRL
jgi:hypothetical protein